MHFPVYVVLPPLSETPSRKEVELYVERALAPHQYIERNRSGREEPEVVQHGWWDWYKVGGSFQDPSHAPLARVSGWKRLFEPAPPEAGPVADLLAKWAPEWAPVRIVTPDGTVHGGVVLSEAENARWVAEARRILEAYGTHLFVVVDCHK
jgi:hypothetical protein